MQIKNMRLNKTDWIVLFCLFIMMPIIVFVLERLKAIFNFNDMACTVVAGALIYAIYAVSMVRSVMGQYRKIIAENKVTEEHNINKEEMPANSEAELESRSED